MPSAGGRSRSPAVVLAYMMSALGISFEDGLADIKRKRSLVKLNAGNLSFDVWCSLNAKSGFERQLRAYGKHNCDVYSAHQVFARAL